MVNVLLLTNRDSDNVGDQFIEACDISLIGTALKNMGIDDYHINSRACSIISKRYMATEDDKLLEDARKAIGACDVLVFGGAPVFNYRYQPFYERTAKTLEIAKELGKPVLFSAIGVEDYGEVNPKCQRLKKTLNFDNVLQITTRDGYESLKQYKENDNLVIGKVSDPAVFAGSVMRKHMAEKGDGSKTVGIFVIRANAFKDNGFSFNRDDAVNLWLGLAAELDRRGINYKFLTSGHFGDEAFLDYLIRECGISAKKCVFNMNSPEELSQQISSFDAVVSCRLHPSIISYAMDVPSLGIVWNYKVKHFYESIGYADRAIGVDGITPALIADDLKRVMEEGVDKDREFMVSIYDSLFNGLKRALKVENNSVPYDYDELLEKMVPFEGTSPAEKQKKLARKFRRSYENYNKLWAKIYGGKISSSHRGSLVSSMASPRSIKARLSNKVSSFMKNRSKGSTISVRYHSGLNKDGASSLVKGNTWDGKQGKMSHLDSGAWEFTVKTALDDPKQMHAPACMYEAEGGQFDGWMMRIRMRDNWYWILENGSLAPVNLYDDQFHAKRLVFKPGSELPADMMADAVSAVAEAIWSDADK